MQLVYAQKQATLIYVSLLLAPSRLQLTCIRYRLSFLALAGSAVLKYLKLEAKDVLPNINRTQAAERAENGIFVSGDLDF